MFDNIWTETTLALSTLLPGVKTPNSDDDVSSSALEEHMSYLAMQGLSWEEAEGELRENFNVSSELLAKARRVFMAAARRVA
jgi:hypothetical protein